MGNRWRTCVGRGAAWLVMAVLVSSCGRPREAADEEAAERRARADVTFLAADELEGRGTPGRGLDLAALYLEAQLRAAGVAPAVSGSYRQYYRVGSYSPAASRLDVRVNGKPLGPQDYVFVNFGRDPDKGALSYEVVDAGTGVVAEERQVNELAGLDVRGKAVLVRKGAPWPLDPAAVFGPDRAMGKLMAATVRGAGMLVYVSEELDRGEEAESKFFAEMKNAPVAFIREPGIGHVSALSPVLVLKPGAGVKAGDRIEITVKAPVSEGRAPNVLGRVDGTDSSLRNEWVVFTAHYDHVGMRDAGPGQDGIWNGADDNASGTAGVLEIARRVARAPGKRSTLVFFTSGEDRGIFGSAWYAAAPVAPMHQVAVQFNLDMIGRSEGKVQGIAPTAPSLFEEAVQAGRRRGLEVIPDQQPSWRLIYLTDLYHFARAGVPGIFFFTGTHPDYHQVTDTADKIRYRELVKITEVAYEIARPYLDGKAKPSYERPAWFVTPE
jgi:hypothetical protein